MLHSPRVSEDIDYYDEAGQMSTDPNKPIITNYSGWASSFMLNLNLTAFLRKIGIHDSSLFF